jgi:hypothetical protein
MEIESQLFDEFCRRELPDGVSLQMIDQDGNVIFENSGKWLHPLFSLENFINEHEIDPSGYFLHDRISGRAAAGLTTRLGFKFVKADMMSERAISLYETYHVRYCYKERVDSIKCQTEEILEGIDDLSTIYQIIVKRRIIPY